MQAEAGIQRLKEKVDTLIIIPNDRLLTVSNDKTSMVNAFKMADEVLLQGVQGITDLITTPGLINTDFADVKMIMSNAGTAIMGIGTASGEGRAVNAAKRAITSPLLEASIEGARGILLNIAGGSDLGLFEVNEAAEIIHGVAHPDANIIFGRSSTTRWATRCGSRSSPPASTGGTSRRGGGGGGGPAVDLGAPGARRRRRWHRRATTRRAAGRRLRHGRARTALRHLHRRLRTDRPGQPGGHHRRRPCRLAGLGAGVVRPPSTGCGPPARPAWSPPVGPCIHAECYEFGPPISTSWSAGTARRWRPGRPRAAGLDLPAAVRAAADRPGRRPDSTADVLHRVLGRALLSPIGPGATAGAGHGGVAAVTPAKPGRRGEEVGELPAAGGEPDQPSHRRGRDQGLPGRAQWSRHPRRADRLRRELRPGAGRQGRVVSEPVRWHFLGPVQRNKMTALSPHVHLWQAHRPQRWAAVRPAPPGRQVLVQVNVTGREPPGGVPARRGRRSGRRPQADGLDVRGLMAVGPGEPEAARSVFRRLAALAGELDLGELSMGMSADLEVAVQEGATMMRIGQALFGPRPGVRNLRR